MSAAWEPSEFHDEYREQLMKWIESKIESGDIHHVEVEDDDDDDAPAPINMMEALKKSLERSGEAPAAKTSKKAGKKSAKKTTKAAAKPTRKKAV